MEINIDFAKNMNEKDASRDIFTSDLGVYNRTQKSKSVDKSDSKSGKATASTNKPFNNIIGRKPIRVIIQDLQRRINMLKSNPLQVESLEQTVLGYTPTSQKSKAINIVSLNKKSVHKWSPLAKRANNNHSVGD